MFELLIPYFIGLALGAQPGNAADQMAAGAPDKDKTTTAAAAAAVTDDTDAAPVREPESQTPTGLYTTATEVKPILGMTRANWIAIQENDGTDFLYFSNLLAWRCGLWEVRYGLNGAAPDTALPLEPCHDDTASPNAITDPVAYPIYIVAPGGSIDSVDLEIIFDDGTTDAAVFARQAVLMP